MRDGKDQERGYKFHDGWNSVGMEHDLVLLRAKTSTLNGSPKLYCAESRSCLDVKRIGLLVIASNRCNEVT